VDHDDGEVAIEEHRIDREAHEPGLDGGRGPKEQPVARLEPLAAQQPAHPPQQRLGDRAPLAQDRAVLTLNRDDGHRVSRIVLIAG
jgi:hypothetical protein